MFKNNLVKICLAVFVFFGFTVFFFLGIRVGVIENAKLQSAIRANLLIAELSQLRGGRVDNIIKLKEMELDSEIYLYGKYVDSGIPWVFLGAENSLIEDRHLKAIAVYRKKFPNVSTDYSGVNNEKIRNEMKKTEEYIKNVTSNLIIEYGND